MKAIQSIPCMLSRTAFVIVLVSLYLPFRWAEGQPAQVSAGYYFPGIPISQVDSTLFSHLIFYCAYLNTSSFEILIRPVDEPEVRSFSSTVRKENPSVKTLLSIWGKERDSYASMVSNYSSRGSFIESSINVAREYQFDGLDLYWDYPQTKSDMNGMANLVKEWSLYIDDNDPQLILTATVPYTPYWPFNISVYPVESMATYLDWIHVKTYSYIHWTPNVTAAHSALYDPSSRYNSTDYGINEWIARGLSPNKLVLGLAYFGYAWNLTDPNNNAIGAPATGPSQTQHGLWLITYKEIKDQIQSCGGSNVQYNDTYVINYWSCGSTWIGFDDVEAIKIKVSYAKEKKLLGYAAWQVSDDDNWLLSRAGNFF
ncbi:class V chitinase-like [Prosopis cineraria]|uniref:class V chitinase-like n=1 Tax=Prosopis cineraria TaxID=364024 RepID=UPI00240FCBBA|nr:class V chitinase-like [Prosopis cineraria]